MLHAQVKARITLESIDRLSLPPTSIIRGLACMYGAAALTVSRRALSWALPVANSAVLCTCAEGTVSTLQELHRTSCWWWVHYTNPACTGRRWHRAVDHPVGTGYLKQQAAPVGSVRPVRTQGRHAAASIVAGQRDRVGNVPVG